MPSEKDLPARRNFRQVWNRLRTDVDSLGDIHLAGFIAQHWFPEPLGIASIGIPTESEFLTLNSLVDPAASLFVLAADHTDGRSTDVKELNDLATQLGFDVRTQFADLTLPGRWAQLLAALSVKNIGLLRVEARWAVKEPRFWDNLRTLIGARESVVYVRGALDFMHSDVSVGFLRSLPADCPVELVAATRTSLWFAPAGGQAKSLREALGTSGLPVKIQPDADLDVGSIFVDNSWADDWVNNQGKVPRAIYDARKYNQVGIEYPLGWASPEPDGRWTDGDKATITITPPPGAPRARRIAVAGNAWIPKSETSQVVYLGLGRDPAKWLEQHFEDGGEIRTVYLELTKADTVDNCITLHIKVQKPGRPSDFGDPDFRVLGFKFRSLSLFT